jgi:hypothetical protein
MSIAIRLESCSRHRDWEMGWCCVLSNGTFDGSGELSKKES